MNIWHGSVDVPALGNVTQTLHDLNISTHLVNPAPPPSAVNHLKAHLSSSSLSFLRFLPPSRVPFYLAAGPSLHITTTSPETALFFQNFFLSSLPKPLDDNNELQLQPQLGLLLRVNPSTPSKTPGNWGVTELLVYGSVPPPSESTSTPAPPDIVTPPASSPPPQHPPVITIHALPLSSHHNFASYLTAKPPRSPQFIAPNPQDILNPAISSAARKRRAETLDKLVEQKAKKPRFPILTALGPNAQNRVPSTPQVLSPEEEKKKKHRRDSIAAAATGRQNSVARTVSRAGSVARPPSSAGIHASGVKKVEKKESGPESKNHENVNRIVLDEMRKRGMQDYRKSGAVVDEAAKEEFKCVFHHSVKAACFALRKDMAEGSLISLERVRDVVRRLVDVFLDDGKMVPVKVKKEDADEPGMESLAAAA